MVLLCRRRHPWRTPYHPAMPCRTCCLTSGPSSPAAPSARGAKAAARAGAATILTPRRATDARPRSLAYESGKAYRTVVLGRGRGDEGRGGLSGAVRETAEADRLLAPSVGAKTGAVLWGGSHGFFAGHGPLAGGRLAHSDHRRTGAYLAWTAGVGARRARASFCRDTVRI